MDKQHKLELLSLTGVPLIMVLGNSMVIPILPDIGHALNISSFKASLIITLFSVPAGIIIPLAGFLSDLWGRKKIIIPSLIIYGLGGLSAGLTPVLNFFHPFTWLLLSRIVQGIGAAGTAPIAMAFTGDLFQGQERSKALGAIESANGMGKVLSPVLGSAIGLISWSFVLLFFPVIVIPIVIGIWLLTRESHDAKNSSSLKEYFSSVKKIFARKTPFFLSSFLSGMIALLLLFGVLFFLSEYLETRYHMSGISRGAVLAIPVLFMSITSLVTGAIIKKKTTLMRIFTAVGPLVSAAVFFLLSRPSMMSTLPFFAFISLAGLSTGMVLPCLNTMITSSVEADERGLITSLYGSVRFFGVAAGPPIFGFLMGKGLGPMFGTAALMSFATAVIAALFVNPQKGKQPPAGENRIIANLKRLFTAPDSKVKP